MPVSRDKSKRNNTLHPGRGLPSFAGAAGHGLYGAQTRVKAAHSRVYVWRRRFATIAVGALALVMAYGVVFGHNGLTAFAAKRKEAKLLQIQMQQLQQENDRLQGRVDRLQNDPSAIEHEARQDLHYMRSGEVLITLPKPRPDAASAPTSNLPKP